ncbi:MAG: beta-propeller fold lactonase family protein [Bryobacteraceae bacterium]
MKRSAGILACVGLSCTLLGSSVHIYVANSDGDNITIIDPATNTVSGEIKVSSHPHGIVSSPDQKRFYVSSEGDNVLDVVDRAASKVIKRIPIGARPNNVAITPDGRRVYICIRQEAWVDIVDTGSLKKIKSVPVGRYPHNVYLTPDGKYMLATSLGDKKITAIDVKTEEPAFDIPLPGVPRPVALDAGPKHLFVQLSNLHGFVVVDYASREIVNKILLPEAPSDAQPLIPQTFSHGIAVAPEGKTLWVTSLLNNAVYVYSLPDLKLLDTTPVGRGPDWMTFTPERCYVSNAGSDSVSVLDAASHKEIKRIPVGKIPKRIITN